MRIILLVLLLAGCASQQTWQDARTPCDKADQSCQAAHDKAVSELEACRIIWWPLPCPTTK